MAHGAGSSFAGTYGPILDGLAAQHTVVGVDYPGSGGTPRATTPLSLDEMADQLVAAAVAEGLDTFALHGYSLGGPVAIRAVGRHPERVTALVLTATMAYPNNQQALTIRVWGKLAATGDRRLVSEFLFRTPSARRPWRPCPPGNWRRPSPTPRPTSPTAPSNTPSSPPGSTSATTWPRSASPPWSSPPLSTTSFPPVLHHQLAENISGAQLVEIPTGHLPMVERPEEWQKLITDFLAEPSQPA